MKRIILSSLVIIAMASVTVACSNGPTKRNSWQKNSAFKNKKEIYYNQFVESGGMIPDESNPAKRSVQEALNQGSYLSTSN